MGLNLKSKMYMNEMWPGKVKLKNTARTKIGEQDLSNRLSFIYSIKCDWIDKDLSKDAPRVILKSAFFKSN